jgi:hypothetical protein
VSDNNSQQGQASVESECHSPKCFVRQTLFWCGLAAFVVSGSLIGASNWPVIHLKGMNSFEDNIAWMTAVVGIFGVIGGGLAMLISNVTFRRSRANSSPDNETPCQ